MRNAGSLSSTRSQTRRSGVPPSGFLDLAAERFAVEEDGSVVRLDISDPLGRPPDTDAAGDSLLQRLAAVGADAAATGHVDVDDLAAAREPTST